MRIIITESQNKILWLRRRLNDRELMDHLKDIVIEGFDYTDPCNYKTYNSFETNIVNESAITFINSYIELYGEESFDSSPLEDFVAKVILSKHRSRIEREYRDRYCPEDEDESDYLLSIKNGIFLTENQNYVLRRLQQFIEIVEDQIEGYELNEDGSWWCKNNSPYAFYDNLVDRSIEEFISQNWNFFHDTSETGGSETDISMLNKIVEENYGNYIRNIFVRKCNQSRW